MWPNKLARDWVRFFGREYRLLKTNARLIDVTLENRAGECWVSVSNPGYTVVEVAEVAIISDRRMKGLRRRISQVNDPATSLSPGSTPLREFFEPDRVASFLFDDDPGDRATIRAVAILGTAIGSIAEHSRYRSSK